MRSRFPGGRAVEILRHPRKQRPQITAGHVQRQTGRIKAFFGDNHDIQCGDGVGGAKPETLAQDPLDAVSDDGIADFLTDGHAESPGSVPIQARPDEQEESLAMIAAARIEAGRELSSRPEPVRRRKA